MFLEWTTERKYISTYSTQRGNSFHCRVEHRTEPTSNGIKSTKRRCSRKGYASHHPQRRRWRYLVVTMSYPKALLIKLCFDFSNYQRRVYRVEARLSGQNIGTAWVGWDIICVCMQRKTNERANGSGLMHAPQGYVSFNNTLSLTPDSLFAAGRMIILLVLYRVWVHFNNLFVRWVLN